MHKTEQDSLRQYVRYKCTRAKAQIAALEGRLKDIKELINLRNPQLMLLVREAERPLLNVYKKLKDH